MFLLHIFRILRQQNVLSPLVISVFLNFNVLCVSLCLRVKRPCMEQFIVVARVLIRMGKLNVLNLLMRLRCSTHYSPRQFLTKSRIFLWFFEWLNVSTLDIDSCTSGPYQFWILWWPYNTPQIIVVKLSTASGTKHVWRMLTASPWYLVIKLCLQICESSSRIDIILSIELAYFLNVMQRLFQSCIVNFLMKLVFPNPFLEKSEGIWGLVIDKLLCQSALTQSKLFLLSCVKFPASNRAFDWEGVFIPFIIRGLGQIWVLWLVVRLQSPSMNQLSRIHTSTIHSPGKLMVSPA